jgi:aspartyl-tRNA(Asn)/glutamyl-tRNA(Gln) amidotransferase subunit A
VQRLRAAGAIVLGKTVTTAFACYDPPPTRNPWHAGRTPGGSSSGSAAAVAAGHVPAAIGSQTGGSITRPAAFCGVCGCKPTSGRTSRRGVMPLAPSLDHVGPLARTVQDLALVLDAIVGFDPEDEGSSAAAWEPVAPLLEDAGRLPAPRLGLLRGAFVERSAADQNRVLEAAVARWRQDGATTCEVRFEPASPSDGGDGWWPEPFDATQRAHRTIMAVEAALANGARSSDELAGFPKSIRTLIDEGRAHEATSYAGARMARRKLRRRIEAALRTVDVLVCPAARGGAPTPETTGDPQFNAPWSLTGLPTVSVPVGFDDDGLPVSVQLVGPALGERGLFAVAAWCEARRDVADESGAALR